MTESGAVSGFVRQHQDLFLLVGDAEEFIGLCRMEDEGGLAENVFARIKRRLHVFVVRVVR